MVKIMRNTQIIVKKLCADQTSANAGTSCGNLTLIDERPGFLEQHKAYSYRLSTTSLIMLFIFFNFIFKKMYFQFFELHFTKLE
jgi:hypothetical protein